MSYCRSKAYRDIWDMVYRVARTDKYHVQYTKGINTLYIVKYILKIVRNSINEYAVDIDDIIRIVEQAVDAYQPDMKQPTLSELRRAELDDIANGIELVDSEYDDIPF